MPALGGAVAFVEVNGVARLSPMTWISTWRACSKLRRIPPLPKAADASCVACLIARERGLWFARHASSSTAARRGLHDEREADLFPTSMASGPRSRRPIREDGTLACAPSACN